MTKTLTKFVPAFMRSVVCTDAPGRVGAVRPVSGASAFRELEALGGGAIGVIAVGNAAVDSPNDSDATLLIAKVMRCPLILSVTLCSVRLMTGPVTDSPVFRSSVAR